MRFGLVILLLLPLVEASAQGLFRNHSPAVEKQLASIRRQAGSPAAEADSFFMVKWEGSLPPTGPAVAEPDCEPLSPAELDAHIKEAAAREGFTPDLLRAVIQQESAYRPCAISSKGAQGLMQLMPETADELGVRDPFDPGENIAGGAKYLGELLSRYAGNVELALGAYNAGPTRVDEYQGIPPIPETINYVADILEKIRDPIP